MSEAPRDDARRPSILGVATQGSGGDDENRLRTLLAPFDATFFPFDRRAKRQSGRLLLRTILRDRPDLVVMEGTGLFGGLAVLQAKWKAGIPFVLSSGDAVEPFIRAIKPVAAPAFGIYERRLYRHCAGFIGWTPYLVGRALSFGAPRGMTAAGWAPFAQSARPAGEARAEIRDRLGIAPEALVFGIVGSLATGRTGFCYGFELVEAMRRVSRPDAHVIVVGDGAGRADLERRAGDRLGKTIHIVGRMPRESVPDWLAAFDVASLPQTLDGVGSFRYTTKISEYLAAGLPIVTSRIPLAYDLDEGFLWRLPGVEPWGDRYLDALGSLIQTLTREELATRRAAVPGHLDLFDRDRQVRQVAAFLQHILEDREVARSG